MKVPWSIIWLSYYSLLPVLAMWPQPRSFTAGSSSLSLSNAFTISFDAIINIPSDLQDAVSRTNYSLFNDNLGRLVPDRGMGDVASLPTDKSLSKLVLSLASGTTIQSITTEAQKPIESRDEAYVLMVPDDGSDAQLSARTTLGLFRGLTTFSQLWYSAGGTIYAVNLPINISDSPAFVSFCLSFSFIGY